MKTISLCGRVSVWLLAGAFTLFPLVDNSSAAGGGGAAGGVGAASSGGGGHGGGSGMSIGGGHAGGGLGGLSVGHSSAGFSGAGQHVSAGFSAGHYGGLVPTGFPSPQGTGVSRVGGYGSVRAVAPGYGLAGRGIASNSATAGYREGQTINRGFQNANASGYRLNGTVFNPTRIRNAWTEPNNPHVNPAARVSSRSGYDHAAYDEDRSVLQNRATPGQHLYPGASNYSALNASHTHAWQGNYDRGNNGRGTRDYDRRRDAYNQFFLTSAFYPYLYGSFFPAYDGYYDNGYLGDGFGDYVGTDNGSLNATEGSPTFNAATGPYVPTDGSQYNDQSNSAPNSTPPTDDNSLPPGQPSSVGPQNPTATEERESNENGPDTLVESVQNELAKRGYYGGKVDSLYNESTRAALRRFQTDQHLAVTGRINEATLHALQLD